MIKRILILVSCAALAGCGIPHFKSRDSYNTMFRQERPNGTGDPYTFVGVGEGSGGLLPRTSLPTDTNSPDFRDRNEVGRMGKIDQPRTKTPDIKPTGATSTADTSNIRQAAGTPLVAPETTLPVAPDH